MIIETKLYKGNIILLFDEEKHRFTINDRNIISVTRATSVVDKSGALMGWAVKLAREFLMLHLKELCADTKGDQIATLIDLSTKQHRIKKEAAADIGTQVHDWAEKFIKAKTKKDYPEIPKDPKVYNGVSAFLKWVEEDEVKFLSSEQIVYSKKYDYAGIMDAVAVIKHKKCPVDFKTSNGIYPEMRFQVAGYQAADEEESGEEYSGNKRIVRFGKEDGMFEAYECAEQDKDFKAFLGALTLRRRLMELDAKK